MEKILTDTNFKDETANGLVLVDFWAPWCGPCRMLSPIIKEVAKEIDEVTVGKLNVDEEQSTARQFQIMSIPTVILFKDGELVETMIGLRPKESYIEIINRYK